ncbi:hypothetical protein AG0111_0g12845 [Alternaria gaisen]|uniref:Uncharacterized protein n=1 Tax=Alternaria gaisen TaxID=167740 RepID=A0ACB6F3L7_9PLEO|nr:hypothetical protein AG0111_0g12845 [Alternaria gaisen]
MATPFVAGLAALMMEEHGKLSPAETEQLLFTTSIPGFWNDGKDVAEFLAPVAQQGAGIVLGEAAL